MISFHPVRSSEKREIPEEPKDIAKAMDDYRSKLSVIESIIRNWDPFTKAIFHNETK